MATKSTPPRTGRAALWLVPTTVLVGLTAVTVAVWWQQVEHQRLLLLRHTEDVCQQASRRVEVFVQSQLLTATVFAEHWAAHESDSFSQADFEEFAALLLRETEGCHAVRLSGAKQRSPTVVPVDNQSLAEFSDSEVRALLAQARPEDEVVVSAPVELEPGNISVVAVLPLRRDERHLGHLVLELRGQPLFDALFHHRIRSEFAFTILDGDQTVFRFAPQPESLLLPQTELRSSRHFPVRNRTWIMTIVPRPAQLEQSGWGANLLIPVFGLALSFGLTVMTHLLLRRVEAFRRARDSALREVAERRRAEEALRVSEDRYRSVFSIATDGLLVLDMNGRIEKANEAACTMHGYPKGGLQGMNVREIIAESHGHQFRTFMDGLRRAKTVKLESVDVRPDGSTLDVEVRGAQFMHQGTAAALAILTDVTERKLAMQQRAQLSSQILMAQEHERERVSRDLHDGLGQMLTALRFELDWLGKPSGEGADKTTPDFTQALSLLETSVQELRGICKGLRPPLLDDLGLEPALGQLVQEFEERAAVQVEFEADLGEEEDLPEEVALCAYRIVQESLTNVRRHADAREVSISLARQAESLTVSVHDDGQGFDIVGTANRGGFGLAGMRERARLVNGSLEIETQPQQGTRIVLRIPLPSSVEEASS